MISALWCAATTVQLQNRGNSLTDPEPVKVNVEHAQITALIPGCGGGNTMKT